MIKQKVTSVDEDMEKMVEAGADRIGTSAGVKLMQKETSDGGY